MVITGEMSANGEIRLPLTVFDADGGEHEIIVALDTGFNGWLTLPIVLADVLELPQRDKEPVMLGDGSRRDLARYTVRVRWGGVEGTITALEAEGIPLIGTKMVEGMVGTTYYADGGSATLFRV